VRQLTVPAGSYLITAEAELRTSQTDPDTFWACFIQADLNQLNYMTYPFSTPNFRLTAVVTLTTAATLHLDCEAGNGAARTPNAPMYVTYAGLYALQVGTIHSQ
jgi:hypothetical protein